jgi:plastocyanin
VKRVSVTTKAVALAALLIAAGPQVGEGRAAEPEAVELTMSNLRFCATMTCSPVDQGYVRLSSGPVPGSDNPHGIIDVPTGATVRWVYRDNGTPSCDTFPQCAGHNVRFEDGTADGKSMGAARARSGPTTISVTITQPPGELIRYFCSINDHYREGMTGILRVITPIGG